MAFYLEKAIFDNCAPFEHLELDIKEKGINVLTAINGKGKTTIISYVVDAFYELAKKHYQYEFENNANKYYRISSPLFNMQMSKPAFVYLRFVNDGSYWDYLDVRYNCSEDDYNQAIRINDKIQFYEFKHILEKQSYIKIWSQNANYKDKVLPIFNRNVLTYFPAYRYENPSYLNDPYSISFEYKRTNTFTGKLKNPIEVITGLSDFSNWILDVLLDLKSKEQHLVIPTKEGVKNQYIYSAESVLWNNLNNVLSQSLFSKKYKGETFFGIGERNSGATRICIMNDFENQTKIICPSIFNLSSGELSLITLFGEILRQADNLMKNIQLTDIQGIVLVDEIDKHLHITLQKEVLPKLLMLFPNVQFIVSSHSPFLNIGLAENAIGRAQIIDLDNNGIVAEPTNNVLYKEVYEMMIGENQRFADAYNDLVRQIKSNTKPVIITEGKTDYLHIRKAISVLKKNDIDVDFYQVPNDWGSSNLKEMLENLSKIRQQKIIIGIFDRDEPEYIKYLNADGQKFKTYGDSNVYAFAIPLVNEEIYGNKISIEHYYNKNNLLKKDDNNRRLFLGSEFYASGNSIDGMYQTKVKEIKHKVEVNGIIDNKVFDSKDLAQLCSVALTKDAFAKLIENDNDYIKDFDFSNFNQILNVIQEIIRLPVMY